MSNQKQRYSVLLADFDRDYLRVLKTYVERMDVFDEYELAYDAFEVLTKAREMHPDVLIISVVLANMDGLAVIDILRKEGFNDTRFIVSSVMKTPDLIRIAYKYGVELYFSKPVEFSTFQTRILNLLERSPQGNMSLRLTDNLAIEQQRKLLLAITRELQRIGLPANTKGFKYVRYAIMLVCADSFYLESMMKRLYVAVAEKFNTTVPCVERNIRHAIETGWIRGSVSYIDEVFGYTVDADKGKPTNAAFIATIADRIRLKYAQLFDSENFL